MQKDNILMTPITTFAQVQAAIVELGEGDHVVCSSKSRRHDVRMSRERGIFCVYNKAERVFRTDVLETAVEVFNYYEATALQRLFPSIALSRDDLDDEVLEFATDPQGVFWNGGSDEFMRAWSAGELFPRSFVSLRGLVIRAAMDRGYAPGSEMDRLLDEVFHPQ